jgi:hypothetical protein
MIDTWDSLHSATLELVRSTPIKQRLVAAYRRNLAELREDQLPTEARASFASVRKMSAQEADDCAALIVEIFGLVSRTEPDVGERQAASVVQLRAVESSAPQFELPVLNAAS